IKPGMLATVTIVTERRVNTLTVPSDAIIVKSDGQNVVFVAQDSVARQRVITTGIITKTETEITSGLRTGDSVVVMGQELLKEGMLVKVQAQENHKAGEMKQ
ncbi:MAG: efflux RND transporter periplasmic adaptor subunit, partial [Bacteroidota bacterium]